MAIQTILLAALLTVVGFILLVVALTKRDVYPDLQQFVASSIKSVFDAEAKELARAYAETDRLVRQIEQLADSGELDISKFATESEKRAYLMAVKKAEDATSLAEASLAHVKRGINNLQSEIIKDVGYEASLAHDKKMLKILLEQEQHASKRVEEERKRLQAIVAASRSANCVTEKAAS